MPGYSAELARDQAASKAGWHRTAEGWELLSRAAQEDG